MSDFLRGVVDFWLVAVFRRDLGYRYITGSYYAGYLAGCLAMFGTALGIAVLVGAIAHKVLA